VLKALFAHSRRWSCLGVSFLFSVLIAGNAQALLVSMDSSEFGSDTITYDTDTGLEWLDPVLGMGNGSCCFSYNEVQAEFASGGLYEGFRFATASELETLFFDSAGIALGSPGASQAIADLIGLVGDTFNTPIFFAASGYYDTGVSGQVGLASLEVNFLGSWGNGKAYVGLSSDSPDLNGGPFGSWLVRDAVAVSEPATLLFIFMAGLAVVLRRRPRI
tara:strand:- start:25249 stop:25902 length:654 start_codon:yes stop_codon:yes gene_type:complete